MSPPSRGSPVWVVFARQSFFFNDTATTEIYTLSLHDALPIFMPRAKAAAQRALALDDALAEAHCSMGDRKSTRLNSSHVAISYAVFCLKKKKVARSQRGSGRSCPRAR